MATGRLLELSEYRDLVDLDCPCRSAPGTASVPDDLVRGILSLLADDSATLRLGITSDDVSAMASGARSNVQQRRGLLRALLTVRDPQPFPGVAESMLDDLLAGQRRRRPAVDAAELPTIAQAYPGIGYPAADSTVLWLGGWIAAGPVLCHTSGHRPGPGPVGAHPAAGRADRDRPAHPDRGPRVRAVNRAGCGTRGCSSRTRPVPGWETLRLAEAVRDHLGVSRVRVTNDLNAAAVAELHRGALRDADPGLVIGLGTGVAAAVTVNGAVVPGHRGGAGEIAYAVSGADWPASPEPLLEAQFSGRALDNLADQLAPADGAAGLCAAAVPSGPVRDALVARVDELARHVVTCCLLLDPQRLVLVGSVARDDLVRDLLRDRLSHALPYPPEVVLSTFAQDAALLGSLTLAAQA
ncbi:ROK family protein [Dactylosporangium salmoneum]